MLQLAKILRNVPDDDDYKVTTRTVVQACGKNKKIMAILATKL